jgi:molecular chaperone DnaJ
MVVETPIKLTTRQKELFHELEALNQEDSSRHSPRTKSWMNKVHEFFTE